MNLESISKDGDWLELGGIGEKERRLAAMYDQYQCSACVCTKLLQLCPILLPYGL